MKKKDRSIKTYSQEEIKKMEIKMREESLKNIKREERIEPNLVSFDIWWAMRSKSIPARHAREIIFADFKARGLSDKETIENYDNGLEKYGIKL